MSNLLKKSTSVLASLSIVFSIVSPIAGAQAAYTGVEAANKLAALGYIVDQSNNPADYRLGDTLTRRENAKTTMKLAGIEVGDSCEGKFDDLSASDWGCKYAEKGLAEGFFAANSNFRPNDKVSKIEALKMVMKARGIERDDAVDWRLGYVTAAVNAGIILAPFTDYNEPATRGWVFVVGSEAVDATDIDVAVPGELPDCAEDDLLGSLLGQCKEPTVPTTPTTPTDPTDPNPDTPTTPVVTTGGALSVSLSPESPESTSVPAGVNGLPAAVFDFTAGDTDVTINSLYIKRRGLSDKDTLTSIAVFTDMGRASNSRNDNQGNNNDEANLNLTSAGNVVVKAGETVSLTIVVDVNDATNAANDEFAIEILDVVASTDDIRGVDGLKSNTMKVGSVDAPTLTIEPSTSVSDPKIGEQEADIFEFQIRGDNDEDVILRKITFQDSGNDAAADLRDFKLYLNNDLVAETPEMFDDYLTFDLGDGINIKENKTEDFTVKADVVEGATDEITFSVDEKLDVTADSTTFGFGAAIDIDQVDDNGSVGGTPKTKLFNGKTVNADNFNTITIEAGELAIVEVDPDFDKIREDKDNVLLGKLEITNVSGKDLELQELGIKVDLTPNGAFLDDGSGNGTAGDNIQNGTEPGLVAGTMFTDFQFIREDTGSSFQLDPTNETSEDVVFSDDNIDVTLPGGKTVWTLEADTANQIGKFDLAKFELSFKTGKVSSTDGGFYAEDYDDNEEVKDITPSSITFNSIDGSESSAIISIVPLSEVTVVRGAKDVVALQFEVEADESSDITVDEIVAKVTMNDTTTTVATLNEIAKVSLYKDSVSDSNLLDEEAGSQLGATTGEAQFNDFNDIDIVANATQTFIVVLDFVDGVDAVNGSKFIVSLSSIDLQDDENDDVTVDTSAIVSAGKITVGANGFLTLTADGNNEANKDNKTILAGTTSEDIFSIDVEATNEPMDIEDVTFTIAGAGNNLKDSVVNASLYLDDTLIETNVNGDIFNASTSADNTQALAGATQTGGVSLVTAVKQKETVDVTGTIEVGDVFTVTLGGTGYTFTAASTAATDVATGLVGVINADASNNTVAATTSGGSFTIEADTAGTAGNFTINSVSATNKAAVKQKDITTIGGTISGGDGFSITIDGTTVNSTTAFAPNTGSTDVAIGLASAINANSNNSVTAVASGSTVEMTAKVAGTSFTVATGKNSATGTISNTNSITNVVAGADNTQAIAVNTGAKVNSVDGVNQVLQVTDFTPSGTIEVGDIFSVTIAGTTVTYTATAGTVANVTAGLKSKIDADGTLSPITTTVDNTTKLTVTAVSGTPTFNFSTSTTDGGPNSGGQIKFTNMTNLIIPESNSELRLVLNTAPIGFQRVGKTLKDITVTRVDLLETTGVDSGKDASNTGSTVSSSASAKITIAPAVVTPAVVTSLNNSDTPEISFTADLGDNVKDSGNASSNVTLKTLTFSTLGSNFDSPGSVIFTINNNDDTSPANVISTAGSNANFDTANETLTFNLVGFNDQTNATLSDGVSETFKITVSGIDGGNNRDTVVLKLLETGTVYDVLDNANSSSLTTNLTQELDLGTRK